MNVLTEQAYENDTYRITYTFKDLDGNAVTPNILNYSLYRKNGDIINSRESASITPASSVSILLTGDDLQIFDDDYENLERYVLLEGNYTDGSTTCYISRITQFPIGKTEDFFE